MFQENVPLNCGRSSLKGLERGFSYCLYMDQSAVHFRAFISIKAATLVTTWKEH